MKIDLDGISLSDTFLRLFDYQGNLIQFDDDGGNGLNSSLEFTATYDGEYYASAASYGDYYTGNYSILATKINESNGLGSDENDYLIGFEGDNTYQFGMGYDVIDYSNLSESITLTRGGTVDKGSLGTDTFLDFYDKIIATNYSNDWIVGISNIASWIIGISIRALCDRTQIASLGKLFGTCWRSFSTGGGPWET
mgnify:CR=1 FL=1